MATCIRAVSPFAHLRPRTRRSGSFLSVLGVAALCGQRSFTTGQRNFDPGSNNPQPMIDEEEDEIMAKLSKLQGSESLSERELERLRCGLDYLAAKENIIAQLALTNDHVEACKKQGYMNIVRGPRHIMVLRTDLAHMRMLQELLFRSKKAKARSVRPTILAPRSEVGLPHKLGRVLTWVGVSTNTAVINGCLQRTIRLQKAWIHHVEKKPRLPRFR